MSDQSSFVGFSARGNFDEGGQVHVRLTLNQKDVNEIVKRMKEGAKGTYESEKYGKSIKLEIMTSRDGSNIYCKFDEYEKSESQAPRGETVPPSEVTGKTEDLPF